MTYGESHALIMTSLNYMIFLRLVIITNCAQLTVFLLRPPLVNHTVAIKTASSVRISATGLHLRMRITLAIFTRRIARVIK